MNADDIRDALVGRPEESDTRRWLRGIVGNLVVPGEGMPSFPTLTTREAYWLFISKGYTELPIVFAHEMKATGLRKRWKQIRTTTRSVYLLEQDQALKLLEAHRQNPTPADFKPHFDIRLGHKLYANKSLAIGSPWSPW